MNEIITRAEARSAGLTRYFTGKPCKRGHVVERFVRDASCRVCANEHKARDHAKHRESRVARMADYNSRNMGAIRKGMQKNYASNPARYAGRDAKRRAAIDSAIPAEWSEFDQFVIEEAAAACKRREEMTGYAWHIDHMIPLAKGGLHAWHNIQVIPARMNLAKGDKLILTDRMEWVGGLPCA